jgi:FKBP-type peptidyl-prolyl cis-trans isomerase 2
MRVVQQGDKVQVFYVKRFQDGSVVSSRGKPPMELTVGVDHPRLPGLGLALVGLAVGEIRVLIVSAQNAYGQPDPRRIRSLARTRFAEHKDLAVGEWVRVWDRRHHRRLVRVLEIRENLVVVNANHRWAGQTLQLEVEVVAIHRPEVASGTEGHALSAERDLQEGSWFNEGGQG